MVQSGLLLPPEELSQKAERKKHMPYHRWHQLVVSVERQQHMKAGFLVLKQCLSSLSQVERMNEWYEWYWRTKKVTHDPDTDELVPIVRVRHRHYLWLVLSLPFFVKTVRQRPCLWLVFPLPFFVKTVPFLVVEEGEEDDDEEEEEDEETLLHEHPEMRELIEALGPRDMPLINHPFHTLPVYYRVKILYALCAASITGRYDLMDLFTNMEYEASVMRGMLLGRDAKDYQYFYMEQFAASDFRIYRQSKKMFKADHGFLGLEKPVARKRSPKARREPAAKAKAPAAKKQLDKRKRASGPVKPKKVRQQHLKERRAFLS